MPEEADDFSAGFSQTEPAAEPSTKDVDKKTSPPEPAQDAAPAPEPEAEAKPSDQEPDEEPDPIADLKKRLDDASHRERSSANRVSVFMKENNQLKEKLDSLTKEIEGLKAARAAPEPEPEADEELDDVLAGAPDLRAAVEKRLKRATQPLQKQLQEALDRLKEVDERSTQAAADLQPLRERSEQAQTEQVLAELDRTHAGWRDTVRSDAFQRWLGEQPPEIRHLYETGRTVRSASTVLRLYQADAGASGKAPANGAGNGAASATDAGKARLREAAGIRSKGTTPKVDDKDSFSAGFRLATH